MRRRLGILGLLGGLVAGCNPPDVAPMTPPGVQLPTVQDEGSEALGENLSQGTVQPSNEAPGSRQPNPERSQATPNREP